MVMKTVDFLLLTALSTDSVDKSNHLVNVNNMVARLEEVMQFCVPTLRQLSTGKQIIPFSCCQENGIDLRTLESNNKEVL